MKKYKVFQSKLDFKIEDNKILFSEEILDTEQILELPNYFNKTELFSRLKAKKLIIEKLPSEIEADSIFGSSDIKIFRRIYQPLLSLKLKEG